MKPEKYKLGEFIKGPIKDVLAKINIKIKTFFGYWYCGHCGKYHSPFVKKYYKLMFIELEMPQCSLWYTAPRKSIKTQ